MCDYQGYEFGAGYMDSVCIDGSLHDADNCDDDGGIYLNDETIPCPICLPLDAIEWWADRNSQNLPDNITEEENDKESRRCAISLVNDIRKNRGLDLTV